MPKGTYLGTTDTYSVARIYRLRDLILKDLVEKSMDQFFSDEFTPEVLHTVTPVFANRLEAPQRTVEQTLCALLGRVHEGYPNQRDFVRAAWIMAANRQTLKLGASLDFFSQLIREEWVPVEFLDCFTDYNWKGSYGARFTIQCLGGAPATVEFKQFFSMKQIQRLGRGAFMLAWDREGKRFTGIDMVGMQTWALLKPGENLGFDHYGCTEIFEAHNSRIANGRKKDCVKGLKVSCATCHYGLVDCIFATHFKTYQVAVCPNCHQEGWYQKNDNSSLCLQCRHKQYIWKRKGETFGKSNHSTG